MLALPKFRLALRAEGPPGFVGKIRIVSLLPQEAPRGICGFALCAHLTPHVAPGERCPPQLPFPPRAPEPERVSGAALASEIIEDKKVVIRLLRSLLLFLARSS